MGSGCGSPEDEGQCGYRGGKMKEQPWCTSTKSNTCGLDMRMVRAGRRRTGRRQTRGRQRRRCLGHGTWSLRRRCCGCRCSGKRKSRPVWTAQAERWSCGGPQGRSWRLTLYVAETVRRSRGMAGVWDSDTEMHRVRKVIAMADYDGALRRTKGHTVQVKSPQGSATAAADQGVTNLVQDGHTWRVVEPNGGQAHGGCVYYGPVQKS